MSVNSQEVMIPADFHSVPCPGAHMNSWELSERGQWHPRARKHEVWDRSKRRRRHSGGIATSRAESPGTEHRESGREERGGCEARHMRRLWQAEQSVIKWKNRNIFCL